MRNLILAVIFLSVVYSSLMPTSACTVKEAQDYFSSLNALFQSYNREIANYKQRGEPVPAVLKEKQQALLEGSTTIRKLFTSEVTKNSQLQDSDVINPEICNRHIDLAAKVQAVFPRKPIFVAPQKTVTVELPAPEQPVKEEEPTCTNDNILKRFGIAVRKQRMLRIAGKISSRERVEYLKLVTDFKKNSKTDFNLACRNLHEYERSLENKSREE